MADQTCRNGYNFCWTQIVRFWRIVSERRKKCHASFYLATVFRAATCVTSWGGGGCQKKSDACPLFCVRGSECKENEKPQQNCHLRKLEMSKNTKCPHRVLSFTPLSVNRLHSVMCFPICLRNSALISLKYFGANAPHCLCPAHPRIYMEF